MKRVELIDTENFEPEMAFGRSVILRFTFVFHFFSDSLLPIFALLIFTFSLTTKVVAQPENPTSVPPPAKIVSKNIKEKLESEVDDKKRTTLALALMDTYMKQAEVELGKEQFSGVYRELGGFQFLMDTTLDHLLFKDNGSGKTQSNLKRYEIGLRSFAPRLELIRRELPSNYEPYVFRLLKNLRESRSKAIDPMFGGN